MLNQNPVIDAAMRAATAAVSATAASPANDMSVAAVADAKPQLQANIAAAIAASPVVQNATNTEAHWWQKRSMWSALASGIVVVGTVGHAVFEYLATHDLSNKGLTTGIVIGAVWSGYSAWRAGTAIAPLGANPVQYRG